MIPVALPLFSALVAGCVHALELDHMSAVTTFVSRRPHPLRAFGFGVWWGLGHSAAILLVGGTLIALGLHPPEPLVKLVEVGVGVMLVALGAWVIAGVRRARATPEAGDAEIFEVNQRHDYATTWVGAVHGLAGTAGFLAIVPATMLASPWLAGAYLALFGAGTMLAMGIYAAGAGFLFHRLGTVTPWLARAIRGGAGVASVVVGVIWLLGAA